MVKRSWRRFDYVLLGALLLLCAYGVTMIYSATKATLGVEDAVQRQIIFVVVGTAVLLVTASVDYRLLEIPQHPFATLTPIVLGLVCAVIVIAWEAAQVPTTEPDSALLVSGLAPVLLGWALVIAVFVTDRLWLEKLDLMLPRLVLVILVVGAVAVGAFVLIRALPEGGTGLLSGEHSLPPALVPYLLVTGLAVIFLLDCLTLRIADILRNPIYVLMLVLLGITYATGQVAGGSQRWLGQGKVQPSELSKILVILVLAKLLADREERVDQLGTVLVSLGVVAVPMVLIYLQPDLGTALTLVAIWVAMIWMAKIRLRHLLILAVGGVALLPLVWFALQDYMRQRLLLFVNPAGNPDDYFNVHQSLVSIGSGGWTGKGLMHGTQSQLHFLRVRHTDFVFAVTAEELGFLGAVAMMGLMFFVLWRILRVSGRSQDTFGRLLAAGVASLMLFQTVVNIGMNLGLLPVTGIPLPFVSYGGSSFITLMLGIGLVESVAMRHRKLEFD
jgi:rod shape determining protein RodA